MQRRQTLVAAIIPRLRSRLGLVGPLGPLGCLLLIAIAPRPALALPTSPTSPVGPAGPPSASAARPAQSKASKPARSKRRRGPIISGYLVPLSELRASPLPRPSGELVLESVNSPGDTLAVNIYNPDGSFNEDSLEALYHFWRCRRTGTEKPIDPHLFEILSIIHDHFGRPIELVSGFRNQEHTTSFHFHGSASDIRVAGVEVKALHEFVTSLDVGGMGIGRYPVGKFIHVDVRPEPSYRWVDYSPPGSSDRAAQKRARRRHNA